MNNTKPLYHIASSVAIADFVLEGGKLQSPDQNTEPLSPNPIGDITPVDFMKAIFGNISSDSAEQPLCCGFADDPHKMSYWTASTMQGGEMPVCIKPSNNCYFSAATYKPDSTGKYRAKKNLVAANYVILLDDIGTKSSTEIKLPLSWLVETSPGNFQGGLILDAACTDLKEYEPVVKELGKQGWSDKGASGAARWMRLPCGLNSKEKYLVGGVAPQVKLVEFHPERRYSLKQIIEAFGLKIGSAKETTMPQPINHVESGADHPFGECDEGGRTGKTVSGALIYLRKGVSLDRTIELCLLIDAKCHHPPLESTNPGKVEHTVRDVYERYIVKEHPDFVIELNVDHFVAREGSKTVVCLEYYDPVLKRIILVRMSFADFINYYSNKQVWGVDKKGKPILIPMGHAWIVSKYRRQYKGIRMTPMLDDDEYFNLWKGFTVKPVKGSWKLMKRHIFKVLCDGNKKLFQYVMGWFARMIQQPGSPGEVAIVLQGGRGTGKGMFGNAICMLLGQHACHVTNGKHVTGNFNAHLEDCVFLFADEAFWAGDKAAENVLKGLITEPVTPIERKFGDLKHTVNMLHILMASNNDWVVPAGLDERRYCVLKVNNSMAGDFEYFAALQYEINNGGLAAMLHELQNLDISTFNVRDVPKTPGLLEQKLHSLEPIQAWWYQKLQEGEIHTDFSWKCIPSRQAYDDYHHTVTRISGGIRKLSETGFGIALKKLLPEGWPVKKKKKSSNMFVPHPVNHYELPELGDCRKHFETLVGTSIPWDECTHLEPEITPCEDGDDL